MQLQLGRFGGEVRLGCVVRVQRGRQRGLCHVSCLCTVFSSLVACHKRRPHLAYQLCWRLIITGALHSSASHTCITLHTLVQRWQRAVLKLTQRLCEPEMMNMQQTTLKFNMVHGGESGIGKQVVQDDSFSLFSAFQHRKTANKICVPYLRSCF